MYMYIHTIQRFEMGYWDGGWRCEWEMLSEKKGGFLRAEQAREIDASSAKRKRVDALQSW